MPENEGDEFHGVDQGSAIGGLFGEWASLYGEVALVFALFAGALAIPGYAYWQTKMSEEEGA